MHVCRTLNGATPRLSSLFIRGWVRRDRVEVRFDEGVVSAGGAPEINYEALRNPPDTRASRAMVAE